MTSFYDFKLNTLGGPVRSLAEYGGKVVLAVNVASFCGYTPHYRGMQALYEKYKEQGFVVLGFPANDFAAEEPGSDEEIGKFCQTKYAVTFPMFSKIHVIGPEAHPLYVWLSQQGPKPGPVEWNFGKFLIDRQGQVAARFEPKMKPDAKPLVSAIESLLASA
jgi:glutathione peroxidase